MNQKDQSRFWEKVSINPSGCWSWTAATDSEGYAELWLDGSMKRANRLAVELATGEPVPPDKLALHHCDNPGCVRPDHIYVGDHSANERDKQERGRYPSTHAVLDSGLIEQLRAARSAGQSISQIARDYDIHRGAVARVVRGFEPASAVRSSLSPEEIRSLVESVGGTSAAARLLGIHKRVVQRWASGERTPSVESVTRLSKGVTP